MVSTAHSGTILSLSNALKRFGGCFSVVQSCLAVTRNESAAFRQTHKSSDPRKVREWSPGMVSTTHSGTILSLSNDLKCFGGCFFSSFRAVWL
jgi:hypothetical protein